MTTTEQAPGAEVRQALTREQAAARLRVHYNTIRLWEKADRLRSATRRVGGREIVMIPLDDVERVAKELDEKRALRKARQGEPGTSEAQKTREEVARLEAQNAELRERVAELKAFSDRLLTMLEREGPPS